MCQTTSLPAGHPVGAIIQAGLLYKTRGPSVSSCPGPPTPLSAAALSSSYTARTIMKFRLALFSLALATASTAVYAQLPTLCVLECLSTAGREAGCGTYVPSPPSLPSPPFLNDVNTDAHVGSGAGWTSAACARARSSGQTCTRASRRSARLRTS